MNRPHIPITILRPALCLALLLGLQACDARVDLDPQSNSSTEYDAVYVNDGVLADAPRTGDGQVRDHFSYSSCPDARVFEEDGVQAYISCGD